MGEIAQERNPKTAEAIESALPITSKVNIWGQEIYFAIPVEIDPESPQGTVNKGDLAYWPSGNAFCIFLGPTPASEPGRIKPASPVNVFGRISHSEVSAEEILKKVEDGEEVKVEAKT